MPLRIGDRNESVRRWREVMAKRFAGYARTRGALPTDTDEFGPRAQSWQLEYEIRTGQPQDGVVSDDDLRALGVPSYGVASLAMKDSDSFAHGLNERAPTDGIPGALAYWHDLLTMLGK